MYLMITAAIVGSVGVLLLGIYMGKSDSIRQDRQRGTTRAEGLDQGLWMWGIVFVGVAIVLAVIAANPAEKLKERADKIRSSVTIEDSVR